MKKITALIMLGLMLSALVGGQVPNTPTAPSNDANERATIGNVPVGSHELTAADVETFLDGLIAPQIKGDDVAGLTVSVVKDGKMLFAKGYGYSDVAQKKPVSAETTLFRPGSVSKLFTWTAVMQLHEQGKLDLDKDVNEYLDFKIPDAFGQPITLKNILTHTAGFEEQIKDLIKLDGESPNLGEYLKTHTPTRIYPPGTVPAYSNYATALAGYIVERVSGRGFNEYVEENIFKPLGMNRSTFAQPLPPALAAEMSNGYELASAPPKPFEIVPAAPAGSLSSTATDMARFMLAHLEGGQLGDARILRPETTKLMHSRLFALDPAANAMCYGFYEESRNGQRIVGHGGDTMFFHSDLHLMTEAKVGFFVSYNSGGRGRGNLRAILWEAFLDRYFPHRTPDAPTLDTAKQNAQAASGTYLVSRLSATSFLKTLSLMSQAKVSANADGTIQVSALMGANGKPKQWREVAPMTFREVDGQDVLVFKPDQNGRMQLIIGAYPFMVFRRVGLWENGSLLLPVVGISLGVMLLTLVLSFVAWLVRKRYKQKLELTPAERWLRFIVRLVFALNLIFVVALIGFVVYATSNLDVLSDKGNIWIWLIQSIGVVAAIGSLAVFYNFVHALINKRYRIWGKLQATVFALACLGILWLVFAGNLLAFKSNY